MTKTVFFVMSLLVANIYSMDQKLTIPQNYQKNEELQQTSVYQIQPSFSDNKPPLYPFDHLSSAPVMSGQYDYNLLVNDLIKDHEIKIIKKDKEIIEKNTALEIQNFKIKYLKNKIKFLKDENIVLTKELLKLKFNESNVEIEKKATKITLPSENANAKTKSDNCITNALIYTGIPSVTFFITMMLMLKHNQ